MILIKKWVYVTAQRVLRIWTFHCHGSLAPMFLSLRARSRIKKRMSSLVNFSFNRVRRHPTWYDVIIFLYVKGKKDFFSSPIACELEIRPKEFVFFAPSDKLHSESKLHYKILRLCEHRAVSHCSVLSLFLKKVLLYRWKKHGSGKKNGKIFDSRTRHALRVSQIWKMDAKETFFTKHHGSFL